MKIDPVASTSQNNRMKLFQLHRKFIAVMGVELLQPFQKNQAMIVIIKRLLYFISLILFVILSSVFLGYEAQTLDEYADSFYGSVSTVVFSLIFAIILWKMDSLFKLIGDFEQLIEQRKKRYTKLHPLVLKYKLLELQFHIDL